MAHETPPTNCSDCLGCYQSDANISPVVVSLTAASPALIAVVLACEPKLTETDS